MVDALAGAANRFWPTAWLLVRVTWTLIVIHLIEIAVWALFFVGVGSLPDPESAFYFSGDDLCDGGLRRRGPEGTSGGCSGRSRAWSAS